MSSSSNKMLKKTASDAVFRGSDLESGWCSLLIISRLHITAIAAMATLTFGWLFTGDYPWLAVAVCTIDWFVINLVNQTVDLKEDAANQISRVAFVGRYRSLLLWSGVSIAAASLFLVLWVNPLLTIFRLAFHALGAVYNWPILPRRRRLKQLYFWKNNASALGFLITVFGYPFAAVWSSGSLVAFPPGINWLTIAVTALYFFLFEVSYEVIYDIRDVQGDALAGIHTYAVVHGIRGAVHIIDGLIYTSTVILVLGYVAHVVPWRIVIMAAAPLIQLGVYKWCLGRGICAKDCICITWTGVALLVFYNLWVVAKLPGTAF